VPERVRPVTFHLPIYRDGPISLRRMLWGFRLMESLDPGGVPLEASMIEPAKVRRDACLRHLRDLDRLEGVVRCVEHQFNWPERICVDAVFNAAENGAKVQNYTPVERIERRPDATWLLHARDRRGDPCSHWVRTIVNAAGAWVDEIARGSSLSVPRLNQGAKASNVAVRLVGEDEIVQLLEQFNDLFPALRIRRDDVIYSWAGVRPRTAHSRHPAGGPAVRVHDLASAGAPGYFAYTGGLLMVHRSTGREIIGALSRRLAPSCPARPLIGSARLFPSQANRLQLHGAHGSIDVTGLVYACEQEGVVELDDLLRRRWRSAGTKDLAAMSPKMPPWLCGA
jgi:glycerol-3-phosphate dehydrogenase